MDYLNRFRLVVLWLFLVVLFRIVDLGMQLAQWEEFASDFPANALRIAELAVHVLVLAGIARRAWWGWVGAAVWIPAWIAVMSVDLWQDGGLILSSLWSLHFVLSAFALRFLLRDPVREVFGVTSQPWRGLRWWLPALTVPGGMVIPFALVLGLPLALCLWTTAAVLIATRWGTIPRAAET
jgi:hypothetical protein